MKHLKRKHRSRTHQNDKTRPGRRSRRSATKAALKPGVHKRRARGSKAKSKSSVSIWAPERTQVALRADVIEAPFTSLQQISWGKRVSALFKGTVIQIAE